MKIYILLPCFNEERALPQLLDRINGIYSARQQSYEVVVVNDGSSDKTLNVAGTYSKKMPVKVIDHVQNKGLGAAMKSGLKYISSVASADDVAVALDADNTHDPNLIDAMVKKLHGEQKDIVIASRYASGGEEVGLSVHRKVLSLGASAVLKTFFGVKGVRDYTCGYRAYSAALLQRAFQIYGDRFIEETGFVCMAEILIKLSLLDAQIDEVGLVLRYDKKEGKSKMKIVKTIKRYMNLISKSKKILAHNRLLVERSLRDIA